MFLDLLQHTGLSGLLVPVSLELLHPSTILLSISRLAIVYEVAGATATSDERLSEHAAELGVVEERLVRGASTMARGEAEPEETSGREPASAGLKDEFQLVLADSGGLGAGVPCTAQPDACVLHRMRGQQRRQQHPPA